MRDHHESDASRTEPSSARSEAPQPGCREPRPETLSAEDDRLLRDLALKIERRGLSAPAVLWLESLRPVSFLGSQAMHFMNPFVQMLVPSETFARLAEILEERSHLERMLRHIEAIAGADAAPKGQSPP